MRYHALATDYDGTLAHDGRVDEPTVAALRRLRESGRRLILVTGRQLDDLQRVFPEIELFERVVAENGALLYCPESKEERVLADRPPDAFVQRLKAAGVAPISVGRVIVATWEPHETEVLAAIRDLGLESEVIFNKGAVMVLPAGVTKATGLAAALRELELSPHNVVAVGDAENDHHLLKFCECGVAVANAVPALKERADWVTAADHGAGVTELIGRLIASDLVDLAPRLVRHAIPIGRAGDGERCVQPYGVNVLLAGASGGGKSTFATGLIERIAERGYQYCVIDPEGDFGDLACVRFGRADQVPDVEQIIRLLEDPDESCVVSLLGITFDDRPRFFARLFPALLELRARTGRPHWIFVDETHHLLPAEHQPAETLLPPGLTGIAWITVYPDHVARAVLELVDTVVTVGDTARETLHAFARAVGAAAPTLPIPSLPKGEAVSWTWRAQPPEHIATIPPKTERRRHTRKYAVGELPPEHSFYFRGPDGKLNLRAQNLSIFMQSADGVDDETWLFHLRRGDYSRWFREAIKDPELAEAARKIEHMTDRPPKETRALVRRQIETRYTAPA